MAWTQAICDRCWNATYPDRTPSRFIETARQTETCAFCGQATESGIYTRVDPPPFPSRSRTTDVAALRSLTDDSDLEQDLAQTERQLERLLSAPCWNEPQRRTIEQQIAAVRRHLVIQRANVRSPWLGMAAEAALEHGDALKGGRA